MTTSLICYECYETPALKRAAQRKGVQRSVPSGLASDYLLADHSDSTTHGVGAIAAVYNQEPGSDCRGLNYTTVDPGYLRERCRRIGRNHLPENWKRAFDRYLQD